MIQKSAPQYIFGDWNVRGGVQMLCELCQIQFFHLDPVGLDRHTRRPIDPILMAPTTPAATATATSIPTTTATATTTALKPTAATTTTTSTGDGFHCDFRARSSLLTSRIDLSESCRMLAPTGGGSDEPFRLGGFRRIHELKGVVSLCGIGHRFPSMLFVVPVVLTAVAKVGGSSQPIAAPKRGIRQVTEFRSGSAVGIGIVRVRGTP
jgi:hypothetical protein